MAQFTESELKKKDKAELTSIADDLGLDTEDLNKAGLIKAILNNNEDDDELDDEVDDEIDDEVEDDEVDEVDDSDEEEDDELPEDDDEEDDIEEEPKPAKKSKAKNNTKKAASGNTLAAKQVALLLGTDAKTLRQFFRSDASTIEPVGSGGRYEFLEDDVPQITEEFNKWQANKSGRGRPASGGKGKSKKAQVEEIETLDEVEEIEDLDDIDEDDLELDDEEDDE